MTTHNHYASLPAISQTATDEDLPASHALLGSSLDDINNSKTSCDLTTTNSSSHPSSLFNNIRSSPTDINNSKTPCDLTTTNSSSHASAPTNINNSDNPCDLSTSSTSTPFNIIETPSLAESVDTDVVMRDGTSSGARDDKNLPAWLTLMIVYLRRVSDTPAWHNLVSEFIDFEKCGPPHGVSFYWISMGTD